MKDSYNFLRNLFITNILEYFIHFPRPRTKMLNSLGYREESRHSRS